LPDVVGRGATRTVGGALDQMVERNLYQVHVVGNLAEHDEDLFFGLSTTEET
jgi:hypothetical protein